MGAKAKLFSGCILLLFIGGLACLAPFRFAYRQVAKTAAKKRLHSVGNYADTLIDADGHIGLIWEDVGELRLNGILYDLRGIEYHDGHTYYRCLRDLPEMAAEQEADELTLILLGHPSSSNEKLVKALGDWLSELYCNPPFCWQLCSSHVSSAASFESIGPAPSAPYLFVWPIPPEVV